MAFTFTKKNHSSYIPPQYHPETQAEESRFFAKAQDDKHGVSNPTYSWSARIAMIADHCQSVRRSCCATSTSKRALAFASSRLMVIKPQSGASSRLFGSMCFS